MKKLTAKQKEEILNQKIRKKNADLASGALRYPAPTPWTGPEQEARSVFIAILQTAIAQQV